MRRLGSLPELREARAGMAGSVGFVPTMGALHAGHLALVERARTECEGVVASVFVNPTQFNDPRDLERYPRDLDSDLAALESAGVDAVFTPSREMIYPYGYRYRVIETELTTSLCGAGRPGHFDGVLSVVLRLFNLVRPDRAYFGEKDWQQLTLVREMTEAFFLPVEVVGVPTVRDAHGVALSSRNLNLGPDGYTRAVVFARILREGTTSAEVRTALEREGIEVEYVEEAWGRRLAAVHIDGVRLIDNVETDAARHPPPPAVR
ncbi:MAG: pantoate--beta-alanine ligase [Longimicrobiales bacterium]|nr:pantoate--beta-alanine ligase [Longimicrobiales bacterium]